MKIYHSFWEGGGIEMSENLYDMHKLSVLSSLSSYGNINLITTQIGKEFLGDLPYTSIELFDQEINKNYYRIWALGKIFAFRQIAQKEEPFLHIDYDVFLFKKLPEYISKGRIIVQSIEDSERLENSYELDTFVKHCSDKRIAETNKVDFAYNTGIFGGNDLEIVSKFVDNVMEIIFSKNNKSFFCKDVFKSSSAYSTLVEQYYLALFLSMWDIEPTLLFEGSSYESAGELGYTHLMSDKYNPKVVKLIKNKIDELEKKFDFNYFDI